MNTIFLIYKILISALILLSPIWIAAISHNVLWVFVASVIAVLYLMYELLLVQLSFPVRRTFRQNGSKSELRNLKPVHYTAS